MDEVIVIDSDSEYCEAPANKSALEGGSGASLKLEGTSEEEEEEEAEADVAFRDEVSAVRAFGEQEEEVAERDERGKDLPLEVCVTFPHHNSSFADTEVEEEDASTEVIDLDAMSQDLDDTQLSLFEKISRKVKKEKEEQSESPIVS